MKKYKIWFGHLFTTAYHFINLIRDNKENYQFEIFCTSNNDDSILLQMADYAEIEPIILNDNEYIEYATDFCKNNNIDIFIPNYKKLNTISKNLADFTKIGTKVLICPDYNLLNLIDDKINIYESFKKNKLLEVPEHYLVNNVDDFKNAYDKLLSNGNQVCIKPRYSQSGMGFRILSEEADSFNNLLGFINNKISFESAYKILQQKEYFEDLIVSEYLDGVEYSIDCLADNTNLYASIPRKKVSKRYRYIEENKELIEFANKFHESYKFPYVYNLQVKYKNGVPKLLEVNPRMSGGLHVSCLSGINFPFLAIKLLLGESINIDKPAYDITVSEIEKEIIIKKFF